MVKEFNTISAYTDHNAAQTLLANIRLTNKNEPPKTIAVVSAVKGEGKTSISIQLACAASSGGHKTLLVDCDLRQGTVVDNLGIDNAVDVISLLSDDVDLSAATLAGENLFLVSAGFGSTNPPEILFSQRFRDFVYEAAQEFDFVIFDTPAVADYVDASIVASIADATVMVVRENYGDRNVLVDAYEQLVCSGAKMTGIAMNYYTGERSRIVLVSDSERLEPEKE